MNLHEIYNELLAGRKLQIKFPNKGEADYFRIRLHQVKAAQDKAAISVGLMEEKDVQKLTFKTEKVSKQGELLEQEPELKLPESEEVVATIQFIEKSVQKQYDVVIVED